MLACISTPAAAIWPSSSERTGAGSPPLAARRRKRLLPVVGQAHEHAAHRHAVEEEALQLAQTSILVSVEPYRRDFST